MSGDKIDLDVYHVTSRQDMDMDIVRVILELVPPAEICVAVIIVIGPLHCILDRPRDV
ncbi:hypothetical protein SODALDRAFT_329878 [Sodiomyces alkalinus F11]|uniref:Uncharacterized protein n=1 Tax=Sodiomyces alkalinus (strain CBS 110278 / VKM F-3762 / F11) TaxID=1314773 RepID=A0A3N2Q0B8_SODAK|nr:hypothetical protein SODALDRAFT_329878 [Sodiomyces alkalinus F11]ROT40203.1 hypothetical protein SODALDRAFT_329878 [Sodiomyces alkalinus F11]